MSTSFYPALMDALTDGLAACAGLTEVNVFSGLVTQEEAGLECIAFGEAEWNESPAAMGGVVEENFTVHGQLRAWQPWQGTTEATIRAARDRAFAIYAEMEGYLADNPTLAGVLGIEPATGDVENSFDPDGRYCDLSITLTVQAMKTP